ncbi:hypothetical protein BYT27DRAFT_7188653, partial [Phlegmacium glaucopus]
MARLSQLSVELHCEILKHALHYSRRPRHCYGLPQKVPPDMEWIEEPRTPSSFPFNAALTCTLWRDILARIPECWTRIVPIINAFEWSKSLTGIELLISEDQSHYHIRRCSSIIFDVMYESSLPPSLFFFSQSAPNLPEIENDGYDIFAFRIPDPHLATSFPSLRWISMDGRAFMDDWFKNLETGQKLSLCIANFRFIEEDDDYYISIQNLSDLHFQNLSVAFRESEYFHELDLDNFHFDDFFACATCSGDTTIFSRCAIPRISQPFYYKEIGESGTWESSLHHLTWLYNEVDYTPFLMLPPKSFHNDSIVYHTPYREKSLKT